MLKSASETPKNLSSHILSCDRTGELADDRYGRSDRRPNSSASVPTAQQPALTAVPPRCVELWHRRPSLRFVLLGPYAGDDTERHAPNPAGANRLVGPQRRHDPCAPSAR